MSLKGDQVANSAITMGSFTGFMRHSYTIVVIVCVYVFNIFKNFLEKLQRWDREFSHTSRPISPIMNILHDYDTVSQLMNQY